MSETTSGTALITGASTGLGAEYARQLAGRGQDLILVARSTDRLDALASEITSATGQVVEVLPADLTVASELEVVAERLRTDSRIETFVNNAGGAVFSTVAGGNAEAFDDLISLNVTAFTRLATAAVDGFTTRGKGTVINISSALAINFLPASAVYSATKSYVLTFTQALQQELSASPVRVQVVLPGAVRTGLWDGSGIELNQLPEEWVMPVEAAVSAALVGLDSGEAVTALSLPDASDLDSLESARLALVPNLSRSVPAGRYLS